MGFLAVVILVTFYGLSVTVPYVSSEEKLELPRDVIDSFKVLEKHTYGLAIYDQDLDGDLDCLVAKRTELDTNAHTTTFLFEFGRPGSPQRHSQKWNFKAGETLDQLVTTVDDDEDHSFISRFSYSDYATCGVFEAPFNGRQECILFTTKEVKDDVSQDCMDQFQDICELSELVFDDNCYEDDE
ncbi:uncharacterized protein LOC144169246 isoform X1 [Haemaphysalis longicornis]